ncbi:hypothetical protein DPSP01_012469 [Paraphaeosphaeria sporulosa]
MVSENTSVPPAPKLALPLQHYFQSKSQPKPQEAPMITQKDTKRDPEQELREILEWARTLDGREDIRTKPTSERMALLEGPVVDLICNDEVVGEMPLRLLVATSAVARNAFIEKDGKKITSFGITQPGVAFALKHLAEYLVSVMKVKTRYYALAATTCAQDIDLLLVADTLGWSRYVHNLQNYWWAKLKNENVSTMGFDAVSAMDERVMTHTDHFKILSLFVDNFASDPKYKEWRDKLPNIEAAVQRREAERAERQKELKVQRRQEKKAWEEAATKQ